MDDARRVGGKRSVAGRIRFEPARQGLLQIRRRPIGTPGSQNEADEYRTKLWPAGSLLNDSAVMDTGSGCGRSHDALTI
jgi:hypothetical protein